MNNFGLIISGNLTGFTTFYETPNVNGILNGVKFNFDFRDLTTILGNEDKAYAISFAPSTIAVSLVTCLLDSFRRPGVLVVSVILPRHTKVESAMNAQNNKALYQLLNAIHDTFRGKNFVNGMLNQNKAVLMQDYYTDILSNYALVPDGFQRPVNARIDVAAPNKHIGYVQSSEENVPLYLSSLCRRSYEGYHHVFIAENAPQNIDEEPVEVVFYTVKVVNNKLTLPNIKLSDRIYNLNPEEGELDIDKNFTYQQVVNGEAGRNIIASIVGDSIEITYRFGKETREIQFSFVDGGVPVPFASVCPRIRYSQGQTINVGNENWLFEGKEIYEPKTIECGNSEYVVKSESAHLDIRRLRNGATCLIQVEKCFPVEMSFDPPYRKLKKITFRRPNHQPITVETTDSLRRMLPGKQEDYSYSIESDYYEKEIGTLPPPSEKCSHIKLRIKEIAQTSNTSTTRGNNSDSLKAVPQKQGISLNGKSSVGALVLENAQPHTPANRKIVNQNKLMTVLGGVSLVIVAVILYIVLFSPDIIQEEKDPVALTETDFINKNIIVTFRDRDGDEINQKDIDFAVFSKLVKIKVNPQKCVSEETEKDGVFKYIYHVEGSGIDTIDFKVSLNGVAIADSIKISASELKASEEEIQQEIKLSWRMSEIKLYDELTKKAEGGIKITLEQKEKYLEKIDKRNEDIVKLFSSILERITGGTEEQTDQQHENRASSPQNQNANNGSTETLPDNIKERIIRFAGIPPRIYRQYSVGSYPYNAIAEYNTFIKNIYEKNKWTPGENARIKRAFTDCQTFKNLYETSHREADNFNKTIEQ